MKMHKSRDLMSSCSVAHWDKLLCAKKQTVLGFTSYLHTMHIQEHITHSGLEQRIKPPLSFHHLERKSALLINH